MVRGRSVACLGLIRLPLLLWVGRMYWNINNINLDLLRHFPIRPSTSHHRRHFRSRPRLGRPDAPFDQTGYMQGWLTYWCSKCWYTPQQKINSTGSNVTYSHYLAKTDKNWTSDRWLNHGCLKKKITFYSKWKYLYFFLFDQHKAKQKL